MNRHVGLPLDQKYLSLSAEIIEALDEKSSKPQAKKAVKAIKTLLDSMFELLVDDFIDQVKMKPFARKVVHQVGDLLHRTTNAMVEKVVGKLSNKELKPLVSHFKSLEFEHGGETYLGYQLDERLSNMLDSCMEHLEQNRIVECKAELVEILEDVMEHSIDLFLVQPMSMIKLGFVSRKVVDLATATIEKAVPPALRKIVEHMDKEELDSLEVFLLSLVFEK